MPCMCGDTYCRSCGPAQGNNRCEACGAWDEDGGCKNPEDCKKRLKEIEAEHARMDEREGVFDDYTGPDPNGKYPCDVGESPCGCPKCSPPPKATECICVHDERGGLLHKDEDCPCHRRN